MTPIELKKGMAARGLSNTDLATITGKTPRQVTSWLSGTHPVPRLVSILMHGLEEGQISQDWLLEIVMYEVQEEARALEA